MGSRDWAAQGLRHSTPDSNMKFLLLLLGILPALDAICFLNSCSKYWGKAETKLKADRSCAVIFDESCCKDSETHFVIPKDGKGKLCGVSSFNPLSSCKGPNIKDDVEAVLVMPG